MHHVCDHLIALLIFKKLNLSNSVLQRYGNTRLRLTPVCCKPWQLTRIQHLRTDLLYLYKLFFGLVDTDYNAFFKLSDNATNTRGHDDKLFVNHSRLNIRRHFI